MSWRRERTAALHRSPQIMLSVLLRCNSDVSFPILGYWYLNGAKISWAIGSAAPALPLNTSALGSLSWYCVACGRFQAPGVVSGTVYHERVWTDGECSLWETGREDHREIEHGQTGNCRVSDSVHGSSEVVNRRVGESRIIVVSK